MSKNLLPTVAPLQICAFVASALLELTRWLFIPSQDGVIGRDLRWDGAERAIASMGVVAFTLCLLTSSCRLRRSLADDCFCLAEICWLAALFKTRRSTIIHLHKKVRTLRHVWRTISVTTKWRGRSNGYKNTHSTVLKTRSTSNR